MPRIRTLALAAVMAVASLAGLSPAAASADIRIVRDSFGVPHVYAATGEDVAYGAGYALAQDRLWQMHFFRLVGKGKLSRILGPVIVAQDKEIRFWTYTDEERIARFATYPADVQSMWRAWVDGINAWMDEVRADPAGKMPLEFAEYGEPLEPWTVNDSMAMADYLIYTFGSGGGAELRNLADLQAYQATFGAADGFKVWNDMIWVNDPDSPASIPSDYDWRNASTGADATVESRRSLAPDARISLPDADKIAGPVAEPTLVERLLEQAVNAPVSPSALRQLAEHETADLQIRNAYRFGSNAQIVAPARTTSGNTALQAGPQVGYYLPQALTDFGLHAADGSLDATGMTFAGAGPAVLIGRGNGYNWTTTTGASDLTDTFIEVLNPADRTQYLFDPDGSAGPEAARWENMECRIEVYAVKGVAGFDEQEICRTRHGPIIAWDTPNNRAYAIRYGWFNREGGTVEGFFRFNQATSLEDFATAANLLASNHNMFYADDQGTIAYWHPGNFPRRPAGDLRLPYVGTGDQEWLGLVTAQETPHVINPPRGWISNWNNKPAVDWDRENGWGSVHRVQALFDNLDADGPLRPDPFGGTVNADRQVGWEDLNANIRYAAFRDFNADYFQQFAPAAGASALEDAALAVLADYTGAIYDANGDGWVDSAGYTILGEFTGRLRSAVFSDDLTGVPNRANDSTLLHVMDPGQALQPEYDWLGAETRGRVAARAFTSAVAALRARFGNDDPRTWRTRQPEQKYTRTNADIGTDVARTQLGRAPGSDPFPGNVPNHIRMNRGTYNHLVVYTDPPTGSGILGESRVQHGSVISPGQSGHISLTGQEAPHFRDQFPLYVGWRYKPMPMSLAEARATAESEVVITR